MTVAVTLTSGTLLVVPPPTSAADTWSPVAVSRDGHTWTRSLVGPLFPRHVALVPGDEMTRTFLVRNQSGAPAVVAVQVNGTDGPESGGLHFAVSSGQGWVPVGARDDGPALELPMASGDVRRVRVRVDLDPRSGNESMGSRDLVQVRITPSPAQAG
ncbi:hypothetical protein ASC77_22340 [Nocardioides sp. Root1257]|nr:hypothetical protein ASC77_22340 [Nocardioides sp. Root1257]KRC41904.1 hypothetical protein ASE24_22130 [Nocardioides sp. Root224]